MTFERWKDTQNILEKGKDMWSSYNFHMYLNVTCASNYNLARDLASDMLN